MFPWHAKQDNKAITKKDISENEINPSYVTFYLTDSFNKPLPNYTGNQLPDYNDFYYISKTLILKLKVFVKRIFFNHFFQIWANVFLKSLIN